MIFAFSDYAREQDYDEIIVRDSLTTGTGSFTRMARDWIAFGVPWNGDHVAHMFRYFI